MVGYWVFIKSKQLLREEIRINLTDRHHNKPLDCIAIIYLISKENAYAIRAYILIDNRYQL